MNNDDLVRLFVYCPICTGELKQHPWYPECRYCQRDGDFFVQRLSGQDPVIVFRSIELPEFYRGLRPLRPSKFKKVTKVQTRKGHPGFSIRCDQTGEVFPSIKNAAAVLGLHASSISSSLVGRRKTAGNGFTFTKVEEDI